MLRGKPACTSRWRSMQESELSSAPNKCPCIMPGAPNNYLHVGCNKLRDAPRDTDRMITEVPEQR